MVILATLLLGVVYVYLVQYVGICLYVRIDIVLDEYLFVQRGVHVCSMGKSVCRKIRVQVEEYEGGCMCVKLPMQYRKIL